MLITAADVRAVTPGRRIAPDAELSAALATADDIAAQLCGFPAPDSGPRTLAVETYTIRTQAIEGRPFIDLGIRPIVSVTSVHVSEEWTWDSSTLVAGADIEIDRSRLYLNPASDSSWTSGIRSIRAIVTAGYDPDECPALVTAVASIAAFLLERQSTGATATNVTTGGGASVSRLVPPSVIPSSLRAALQSARLSGSWVG